MQWKQNIQATLALFCLVASICVSVIPKWYKSYDEIFGIQRELGLWRDCVVVGNSTIGSEIGCFRYHSMITDPWLYLLQGASILSILLSTCAVISIIRPFWRGYTRGCSCLCVLLGGAMTRMAYEKFQSAENVKYSIGPCFSLCIAVMCVQLLIFVWTIKTVSEPYNHTKENQQDTSRPIPAIRMRYAKWIRILFTLTATVLLGCSTFLKKWKHMEYFDGNATSGMDFGIWTYCMYGKDVSYCFYTQSFRYYGQSTVTFLTPMLTDLLNMVQATSVMAFVFSLAAVFSELYILRKIASRVFSFLCMLLACTCSIICLVTFSTSVSSGLKNMEESQGDLRMSVYGVSFYFPIYACILLGLSAFLADPKSEVDHASQPLLENV